MNAVEHMAIGAVTALLPDVVLAMFGWRKKWLPENHLLVRAHRFLHGPNGWLFITSLAVASHLIADYFSHDRN